jgi:hypothetical protein
VSERERKKRERDRERERERERERAFFSIPRQVFPDCLKVKAV